MSGRILVALATTRTSQDIGQQAVAEAKARGVGLVLLLVGETDELRSVYELRTDPVLLGTRPIDEIVREIEEEHRRMLDEQAEEIEAWAAAAGVPVERRAVAGKYDAEIARAAASGEFATLFWLRQSRGFIARFFLGSAEDEVVRSDTRG